MPDQVLRVTNGSSLVVRTGTILGVGPPGPAGPSGPQGEQGDPGTYIYFTPTAPTASYSPAPRTGDQWCDPATGILSIYDASTGVWTVGTTSIRGPQGLQGIQGPKGATGAQGPAGNSSSGFATFNDLLPPANRHP